MQRRYVDFRLAHTLNDYAYRQRLLGLFGEAQAAIEECIALKEGGAALPRSLAVSLSEYSQILVVQGRLREALTYNGKALQVLDKLIEEGDKSLNAEKGMLLTERAQIYMQQARVEEAKQLFQQAVDLIGNSTSRRWPLTMNWPGWLTRVHSAARSKESGRGSVFAGMKKKLRSRWQISSFAQGKGNSPTVSSRGTSRDCSIPEFP